MYWSPKVKISFTEEELVQHLNATRDSVERRGGNWWTFFNHLDHPEQARLLRTADVRWQQSAHSPSSRHVPENGSGERPGLEGAAWLPEA
jgi:hypothetical protein